jgi:hypothetical protein
LLEGFFHLVAKLLRTSLKPKKDLSEFRVSEKT